MLRLKSYELAQLFQNQDWRWNTNAGTQPGFVPTAEQIDDIISNLIAMIEVENVNEAEAGRVVVRKYELGYDILVNFGDLDGLDKHV